MRISPRDFKSEYADSDLPQDPSPAEKKYLDEILKITQNRMSGKISALEAIDQSEALINRLKNDQNISQKSKKSIEISVAIMVTGFLPDLSNDIIKIRDSDAPIEKKLQDLDRINKFIKMRMAGTEKVQQTLDDTVKTLFQKDVDHIIQSTLPFDKKIEALSKYSSFGIITTELKNSIIKKIFEKEIENLSKKLPRIAFEDKIIALNKLINKSEAYPFGTELKERLFISAFSIIVSNELSEIEAGSRGDSLLEKRNALIKIEISASLISRKLSPEFVELTKKRISDAIETEENNIVDTLEKYYINNSLPLKEQYLKYLALDKEIGRLMGISSHLSEKLAILSAKQRNGIALVKANIYKSLVTPGLDEIKNIKDPNIRKIKAKYLIDQFSDLKGTDLYDSIVKDIQEAIKG